MTAATTIPASRPLPLSWGRACLREGVARSHGCERNWARMKPRPTTTNRPHQYPQRWVEKVGRSITGSETPHPRTHLAGHSEVRLPK